jgi:hypothetical protein
MAEREMLMHALKVACSFNECDFEGDASELAKHAKAFKHKCQDCKSHYSSSGDLTAHCISMPTLAPNKHICTYDGCRYKTGRKNDLMRHLERHAESKDFFVQKL